MQLKKYHIRKTPTFDEKTAPHGIRRKPADYDQTNNLAGQGGKPPVGGSGSQGFRETVGPEEIQRYAKDGPANPAS